MKKYFSPSQVCGIWTCIDCTRGCGINKSAMEYEFHQENTNSSMAQWSCAVCRMYKLNLISISPENTITFQEFSLLQLFPDDFVNKYPPIKGYIILGNVGKLCGSFQFLGLYSRSSTKITSTSLTATTQCRILCNTVL